MNSSLHEWSQAIVSLRPRHIGALPLVWPILEKLQVRATVNEVMAGQADIDLGRIVLLLTLNRLLSPQPLYQVETWLAETVVPELLHLQPNQVYDNRLGRGLDRLYPHWGELWARLVSRAIAVYDIDLSAIHWDITSIYFEGAYLDSELAAYGYSRDQRSDTKQVNLQVDVSHDGYVPLLYHLLPGNTADITRPLPHLQTLLTFLARPELAARHLRPILVSDCKMITPEAVLACRRHNLFYLGPLADSRAVEAVVSSVTAEELADHPLAYRPQRIKADDSRFVPYQGVWRSFTFEYEGEQVTDRVLVVWSAGKQRLDEEKRKKHLKRLLNRLADIQSKLNQRRYKQRAYAQQQIAKVRQGNAAQNLVDVDLTGADGALYLTFRINRQNLVAAQQQDGRYPLATNAGHLAANEALTLFKGQDGAEKRFRTVKGPLQVQPLFVRSDQRIEGLLFITLLALLVRAILERQGRQQGLAFTADRLWRGFAGLQAVDMTWQDGTRERRAADMTPFQEEVLQTLRWPLAAAYARLPSDGTAAHW
jgi:transposase